MACFFKGKRPGICDPALKRRERLPSNVTRDYIGLVSILVTSNVPIVRELVREDVAALLGAGTKL